MNVKDLEHNEEIYDTEDLHLLQQNELILSPSINPSYSINDSSSQLSISFYDNNISSQPIEIYSIFLQKLKKFLKKSISIDINVLKKRLNWMTRIQNMNSFMDQRKEYLKYLKEKENINMHETISTDMINPLILKETNEKKINLISNKKMKFNTNFTTKESDKIQEINELVDLLHQLPTELDKDIAILAISIFQSETIESNNSSLFIPLFISILEKE